MTVLIHLGIQLLKDKFIFFRMETDCAQSIFKLQEARFDTPPSVIDAFHVFYSELISREICDKYFPDWLTAVRIIDAKFHDTEFYNAFLLKIPLGIVRGLTSIYCLLSRSYRKLPCSRHVPFAFCPSFRM